MNTELYFQDIKVGAELPVLVKKPVSKVQLVRYAGASGDFNPLHTDPEAGKAAGIGQIAHGMLIMGFVAEAVTHWVPKKYLRKFSVRFAGMTRPDDVITVTGKVTEKKQEGGSNVVKGELLAKNQKDETVIAGSFEAALPEKK
jgi:acyl dehydratase